MPEHIGRAPDFVLVGAQRSGTTYLHKLMGVHPGLYIPEVKELHYFDLAPVRGTPVTSQDYFSNFSEARPDQIAGEMTPSYMYFPWVAKDLAQIVPKTKLLFVLRDPVERAYSHYWKRVKIGGESLSFEDALEAETRRLRGSHKDRVNYSYADRGFYMRQVKRFAEHYAREEMLFLTSEGLFDNPKHTLATIFAFLGLEAPEDEISRRSPNHSPVPARLSLHRKLSGVHGMLKGKRGVWRLAQLAARTRKRIRQVDEPYPPMKSETRKGLADLYRTDAEELRTFTGLDLDHWSVFREIAAGSNSSQLASRHSP